MQAVVITKPGGPEVLRLEQVKDPEPQKHEVRVRIKATAVNRADIVQRRGHYPAPADSPQDILGLEFAGIVDTLGTGVTEFKAGDRVFGLAGGGTYADFVVVQASTLSKIPENLSFVEAASIPEMFITGYDAMISQCCLQPGNVVLIHAIGSGVGMACLQLAKLYGATTIGTARTAVKLEQAKKFGLDHGILVHDGTFATQVMDLTDKHGADIIVELVGGNYVEEDLNCAANKGRIIIVGLVAGINSNVDLGKVLRKRLTIKGTTLRMRPLEEKIVAAKILSQNLAPLFEKGLLKPTIDKILPLSAASQAHEYMEKNENFGKIVLEVSK